MYEDPRDHVFTLYPYHDVVLRSAEGCILRDTDGKEYLDLAAGQLSAALGHAHPRLVRAARAQASGLVHLGNRFFAADTLEACAEIAAVTPEGLDKVVLCSTGSEANEVAIRMARAATGKPELVGIARGYYGCTNQTLSLSEYVGFIKGVGLRAPGVHRLICPDCARCPLGLDHPACKHRCLRMSMETLTAESTGDIAAFIVEPILGSGGIITPPPGYMKAVADLCKHHDALLIADEAQTGLGRTGRWWGMEHHGVTPDILVLSKGLGAGFPVAAVVTTEEIEVDCLAAPMANQSSHSFDPFGAGIAREVLMTIRDEGLVERAERSGAYFRTRLRELADRAGILDNVRGLGLMIGLDVVSPESGERDPMMSLALEAESLKRGVVLGYSAMSGVVRLLPPLTITEDEIERAVESLDRAVQHLEEEGIDLARYIPAHEGSLKLAMSFISKLND